MSSPSQHWRLETDSDRIAWLTFDLQGSSTNTLGSAAMRELNDRIAEIEAARSRAVVIRSAKEGGFVAGADITEFSGLTDLEQAYRLVRTGQQVFDRIEALPMPTVAAIHGFALGGGLELALACDLRVASSTARLGQPEIDIGVLPGWGGSIRLARTTTLGFAKELIFTGRPVDAAQALDHGLVNAVYEPDELAGKTLELAAGLAAKSRTALAFAKEATNLALQGPHRANLETEARLFAMAFSSEDQKEGMAAFIEKRDPKFTGR
jgi:enoyl-CoA hydratase